MWQEEGYTIKYSLSQREIQRAKPEGFSQGSGYISSYIPTRVTKQTFSIITPELTFLEINIGRFDSPYCSDSWAIRENIAQLIESKSSILYCLVIEKEMYRTSWQLKWWNDWKDRKHYDKWYYEIIWLNK